MTTLCLIALEAFECLRREAGRRDAVQRPPMTHDPSTTSGGGGNNHSRTANRLTDSHFSEPRGREQDTPAVLHVLSGGQQVAWAPGGPAGP